jgi:predicted amidohydrolase
VRATLAQLAPQARDVSANLGRVQTVLDSSKGTDLVMFPELFLSGYELGDVHAVSVDLDGPEAGMLREAARDSDTAIVIGAAERVAGGVANSALCISRRGELAGVYRKTHLFGAEAGTYVPGNELVTVELEGRTVGLMICFDVEFPEVARTLALRGADVLVSISANPEVFQRDHEVFVPARALENGVPHLYVNRVGRQEDISFGGTSMAIDPEGTVLTKAGPNDDELLYAEIGDAGRRDARTRYVELLRPSVYDAPIAPHG